MAGDEPAPESGRIQRCYLGCPCGESPPPRPFAVWSVTETVLGAVSRGLTPPVRDASQPSDQVQLVASRIFGRWGIGSTPNEAGEGLHRPDIAALGLG